MGKTWSWGVSSPVIGAKNTDLWLAVKDPVNTPTAYSVNFAHPIIREGKMTCIDVDECLVGSHQCSVNAACHNTVGSYKCSCASGFAGDGKNCGDIDECAEPNPCMADSHCVNFPGTFACICDSGFSGSGRSIEGCQDVDECLLRTATCPENSKCSNIRGGFTCNCNPGYERRSDQCVNIDECAENLD